MSRLRRQPLRALTLAMCVPGFCAQTGVLAWAQAAPQNGASAAPYMNRNLIVIDAAHGGDDPGAPFGGPTEKDVTLALATKLQGQLAGRGFTVVLTREGELPSSSPVLTTDQRAGIANHLRPVACVVVHATAIGNGVHVYASSLPMPDFGFDSSATVAWETAQTAYLPQSLRLGNDVGLALKRAKVPVILGRISLRPLDNLTCPAIAVEVGPLGSSGSKATSATDAGYQQRLAETLAGAMTAWRDTTNPRPAPKVASPAAAPAAVPATPPAPAKGAKP